MGERRANRAKVGVPREPAEVASDYRSPEVGDRCEVHAFGYWYPGEVVKVGPRRVTVRYATGSGTVRDKAVGLDKVRGWAAR